MSSSGGMIFSTYESAPRFHRQGIQENHLMGCQNNDMRAGMICLIYFCRFTAIHSSMRNPSESHPDYLILQLMASSPLPAFQYFYVIQCFQ
jgi:hypothetical protein